VIINIFFVRKSNIKVKICRQKDLVNIQIFDQKSKFWSKKEIFSQKSRFLKIQVFGQKSETKTFVKS